MAKSLIEKIADRFIGLNMDDASTLERQVATLLIDAKMLDEDENRDLRNAKLKTIYIVHFGEQRFVWHTEAKTASTKYAELCANFDKQNHRRILVRLFHVQLPERLTSQDIEEALKAMDLDKLAEKATQYKWCGHNG